MTDVDLTTRPIEPVTQFTLNHDDPYSQLALYRTVSAAMEAYETRYHQARHHEEQIKRTAHDEAMYAAITAAGRSYAAAALNRVVHVLADKLDEDTLMALGDTASALDLAVVEYLDGANGMGRDRCPLHDANPGEDLPGESCTCDD